MFLFGVSLFSSGCAEFLDKELFNSMMPTVAFSGLDVGYVDFEQVETDFIFEVQNPNPQKNQVRHKTIPSSTFFPKSRSPELEKV